MSEVDRLRVVYEVNDRQYVDGMKRIKRAGEEAEAAIVTAATNTEQAVAATGKAVDAAAKTTVSAKKREGDAAKQAAREWSEAAAAQAAATRAAEAAAKAQGAELDRLKAKFDPLYASSKQYERALEELNRAHSIGAVNSKQYDAVLESLNRQYLSTGRASSQAVVAVTQQAQAMKTVGTSAGMMRSQIQNVAFQVGDFATQVGAGTSASMALGQQLPQLLGGFGALGAILGAVVAIGVPLGAALLRSGEEAKTLDEAIKELNGSLAEYETAAANALTPTDELVEKYGRAAGAAQVLLQQLAQIAKLDAATALRASGAAIREQFEDLPSILALVDAELASFGEGSSGIETLADTLQEKFGITIERARELQSILNDQSTASTPAAAADAMGRLAAFIAQVNLEAGYTNDAMLEVERATTEGALAGYEFSTAMDSAAVAAGGVAATVNQLPGAIDAATASAINLTRALGAAIAAAQSIPGTMGAPSLNRFGNGEDITRRAGGLDLQEQQTFRPAWIAQMAAADAARAKAARGGGGAKKGAKGKKETTSADVFEGAGRDLKQLERQLVLVGKNTEETARYRAEWEMVDALQKAGIPMTAKLNESIQEQAAAYGFAADALEKAEQSYQQFESTVDDIADTMAGALVAGESLREGFANILKGIASDILSSGIRNAIMGQFGGMGGGGGFNLMSLFGGGDKLSGALRLAGARASGGPVSGGSAYLVGERGPEVIVPRNNGMVIPNNQLGQGGGVAAIDVTVAFDESGNLYVKNVARMEAEKASSTVGKASTNLINRRTGSRRQV